MGAGPQEPAAASLGLIVAVAPGGVIGRNGSQPWDVPEDLDFFRSVTTGRTLIVGRTTFDAIPKPPTGRRLVVVSSRSLGERSGWDGVQHAGSLEEAVMLARANDGDPIVAGGAQIYASAMPAVTEIWWTDLALPGFVPQPGDTLMPDVPWSEFDVVETRQLSRVATGQRLRRGSLGGDP